MCGAASSQLRCYEASHFLLCSNSFARRRAVSFALCCSTCGRHKSFLIALLRPLLLPSDLPSAHYTALPVDEFNSNTYADKCDLTNSSTHQKTKPHFTKMQLQGHIEDFDASLSCDSTGDAHTALGRLQMDGIAQIVSFMGKQSTTRSVHTLSAVCPQMRLDRETLRSHRDDEMDCRGVAV
ncbi:hypothetical protein ABB37_08944 [Leptomonas pyrrhocoris]|uniref:Uncharacterized protein n=1 Tax=Leptomonas pyrrhocoris TaxID=157538 RepID=A0A0N0DRU7_LEPPY|nr:hypothetical protein ABB37_08944 [Leptomonas pyrrhocoris]KPA74984.1 hypothetical protein ABB37_08944 [Leptomonas pyrrhocoris]|eukprot:XP_015653423.1 hypothetical protein ABB37_08944 [Leptomonas pyrrhocoris]